tara:strand:+ start:2053 stop:2169 length:117 start_codon:yes stop_codon:yes gene_type:complete
MKKKKSLNWEKILGIFAYILGVGAIIFTIIMIFWAVLR